MISQRMGMVLIVVAICLLATQVATPFSILAIILAVSGGYLVDEA